MLLETLQATPRAPATRDEAAARHSLRAQIAHLESRLAAAARPLPAPGRRRGTGRLLCLAELAAVRDELVGRAAAAEAAVRDEARAQARARARVEAMMADPAAHRWERVTRTELGESGCGDWHVRPRCGILGMLAGWWEVKLSSGCP